jgi:hypothetical protein
VRPVDDGVLAVFFPVVGVEGPAPKLKVRLPVGAAAVLVLIEAGQQPGELVGVVENPVMPLEHRDERLDGGIRRKEVAQHRLNRLLPALAFPAVLVAGNLRFVLRFASFQTRNRRSSACLTDSITLPSAGDFAVPGRPTMAQ